MLSDSMSITRITLFSLCIEFIFSRFIFKFHAEFPTIPQADIKVLTGMTDSTTDSDCWLSWNNHRKARMSAINLWEPAVGLAVLVGSLIRTYRVFTLEMHDFESIQLPFFLQRVWAKRLIFVTFFVYKTKWTHTYGRISYWKKQSSRLSRSCFFQASEYASVSVLWKVRSVPTTWISLIFAERIESIQNRASLIHTTFGVQHSMIRYPIGNLIVKVTN